MTRLLGLLIAGALACGAQITSIPSVATGTGVITGSGAPSATTCDSAGEVGSLYARTGVAAYNATFYVCENVGAATYAWVLKGALAGTGITVVDSAAGQSIAADTTVLLSKATDTAAGSKIWLQAATCSGTTATLNWDTIATLAPAASCSAGSTNSGLIRGLAAFLKTEVDQIQTHIELPADFTGAVDLKFVWQTAATTGSVVWQAATVCVADAEVNDAAWNAASTVTDAAKGTTLQTNTASIAGVTATGCAAGELLHLKVFRDPDHASDDLDDTASLIGVEVTTRRAK